MEPKPKCCEQNCYPTKESLKNYEFSVYRLSLKFFKFNHILKLEEKIVIEDILFINKSFNNLLPPIFKSWFTFCSDVHNYQAVSSTSNKIFKPSYRADSFGKNSITIGSINRWNKTQHQLSN